MLISEVVVLKSFVELPAVVAKILRVLGLLFRLCLWFSIRFLDRPFLDHYFLDDSTILFYL